MHRACVDSEVFMPFPLESTHELHANSDRTQSRGAYHHAWCSSILEVVATPRRGVYRLCKEPDPFRHAWLTWGIDHPKSVRRCRYEDRVCGGLDKLHKGNECLCFHWRENRDGRACGLRIWSFWVGHKVWSYGHYEHCWESEESGCV